MSFRVFFLLVFVLASDLALASETRVRTLGNPAGLRDETNVYVYPAAIVKHSTAIVELGNEVDRNVYGGAFKKFGTSSYGFVLSRDESLMTTDWLGSDSLVDDYINKMASNTTTGSRLPEPERPLDLLFGTLLDKKTAIGMGLTFASYKSNTSNTEGATDKEKREADQLDLHFGYSTFGASRLDIGLTLGLMGTLKSSTDTDTTDTEYAFKRGTSLSLGARYISKISGGVSYYDLKIASRNPSVDADNGTISEEAKFSEKYLEFEGGAIFKPVEKTHISAALTALYGTSKGPTATGTGAAAAPSFLNSDEASTKTLNWIWGKLGIELPVTETIGLLGGMQYSIWGTTKTEDKTATGKPKTETSITETADANLWSFGLYYAQDALRIDASYRKAFLHNGPFFISGNDTDPMLSMISLTYKL